MKIEFETNLNGACLHIYLQRNYEEDYQIPMIRHNKIEGILPAAGCEIEGKSRFTYEISGYTSMQKKYEKTGIKAEDLKNFVTVLLKRMDEIQKFMLVPDGLVLNSECIFQKDGEWSFCYLPGNSENMNLAFHKLTEYFVKTVDYTDTDAIFLAYELHRASFQEHYDLRQILTEYEKQGKERDRELEDLREKQKLHENIFSLTEEERSSVKTLSDPSFTYDVNTNVSAIREEAAPDGCHGEKE